MKLPDLYKNYNDIRAELLTATKPIKIKSLFKMLDITLILINQKLNAAPSVR